MRDDEREDIFFCDGCGKEFASEDRADLGEPFCVACWEKLPHDEGERP